MTIWLISPYGPIPGEGWRDYRLALVGKALAAAGYESIWWTANFSHHFKRYRSEGWEDREVVPGFTLRLVPTASYTKNVSVGRLRFQRRFAANVLARGRREPRPSLIFGVDPPQPIGTLSRKLAQHHRVPLVLDVMDQWPELFALALPAPIRPAAPLIFWPWRRVRARNYESASAITALAENYLKIALTDAPSTRNKPHFTAFNGIDVEEFRAVLRNPVPLPPLPAKSPADVWAIYAGTLGSNYDVDGIMAAATELKSMQSRVTILVAGSGPRVPDLQDFIARNALTNLHYLGKLDHDVLISLYGRCDIGIAPYGPQSNVEMPDKAYDYLAAGLPIVNSLRGELADFLARSGTGVQYEAGNGAELARQLDTLARDEAARTAMARRAWEEGTRFDARVQYAKFAPLIAQLIGT